MELQKPLAPILKFETRAKQNMDASLKAGRPVFEDVDMLVITPPGTRDTFEADAKTWLAAKRDAAARGQYPLDWIDKFEEGYARWKSGNAMPESGWALKMCPAYTPAEVAMCAGADVATVESLAQVPDGGLNLLGLHGRILRDRARALLASDENKNQLIGKVETLNADVETLTESLKSANAKIQELESALQAKKRAA
jgi:hypothetical protein